MEERVSYGTQLEQEMSATHRVIRELSGTQNGHFVNRLYMEAMGGIEGGLFLSQLVFWHDKGKDEWFYKSYDEWRDETMITKYAVRKYADKCKEAGFLETKVAKADGSPTVYYKVDMDALIAWVSEFVRNQTLVRSKSNDPGSFEIKRSYKQNITSVNDIQNKKKDYFVVEKDSTTRDDDQSPAATSEKTWEDITDYWRVAVSGKNPTPAQTEWLWELYVIYKGELLYEAIREAVRNNRRGGLPTYNFVRAICKRIQADNGQSEQRRLAISGETPVQAAQYNDPMLDKLRTEMLNGRHGTSVE